MNQKLSDWANIAEIVSAVAIVVSLIFVGMEIRRNTEAEYLSSYDRLLADTANFRMTLATNRETLEAFTAFREGIDSESTDPIFRLMGLHAATVSVQIMERAYFARMYGRLGDAEWGRYQTIMCDPNNLSVRRMKSGARSDRFSQEFWEYLIQCTQE